MMPEQQYDYSDPEVAKARVESLKDQQRETYAALDNCHERVTQRDTTIKEMRGLLEKINPELSDYLTFGSLGEEDYDYINGLISEIRAHLNEMESNDE